MSGVYVSLHTHLSGKGSQADGRKLECKIICVEEEKQPVGMFPLGCLEWINLSNCLSSVDLLYAHTAKHGCIQAGKQIHTHMTFASPMYHLHPCIWCVSHIPALPCALSYFSLSHTHTFSPLTATFKPEVPLIVD